MFFVVLDSRTDTYYNKETCDWTPHLVCATFFDFRTQAAEIANTSGPKNDSRRFVALCESEDLSAAHIDVAVDILVEI